MPTLLNFSGLFLSIFFRTMTTLSRWLNKIRDAAQARGNSYVIIKAFSWQNGELLKRKHFSFVDSKIKIEISCRPRKAYERLRELRREKNDYRDLEKSLWNHRCLIPNIYSNESTYESLKGKLRLNYFIFFGQVLLQNRIKFIDDETLLKLM